MNSIRIIILTLSLPFFIHAMEDSSTESVQRAQIVVYGQIDSTHYSQCISLMHSIMAGTCEIDGDNLEFPDTKDATRTYATPFNTVHHALMELMSKDELNLEFVTEGIKAFSFSSEEKRQLILKMLNTLTQKDLFQIQLDEFKEFYQNNDLKEDAPQQPFKLRRKQVLQSLKTGNKHIFSESIKLKLSQYPIKPVHEQIELLRKKNAPIK